MLKCSLDMGFVRSHRRLGGGEVGAVSPTVTPELSQGRALQEDDVGVVGRGHVYE